MNQRERAAFYHADQKIHYVENEAIYPTFIKHGFTPVDLMKVGLVRSFLFTKGEHQVRYSVGVNADYWTDLKTQATGYWKELDKYLATKN